MSPFGVRKDGPGERRSGKSGVSSPFPEVSFCGRELATSANSQGEDTRGGSGS